MYRRTGNILLSSLMGADLYLDDTPRPIEDQGPLTEFVERLRLAGHSPYLIPGGASEHRLGSFGYLRCAAEIVEQSRDAGVRFRHLIHCTGSSSTQAGLLAGFAFMAEPISVIGVADDHETEIKRARVLELANNTLAEIGSAVRVPAEAVEIIAADRSDYGAAEPETIDIIRRFARSEGIVADPVYEGKALRGLEKLIVDGRFEPDAKVLVLHLGGTPAIHAYADRFGAPAFQPFQRTDPDSTHYERHARDR
jgi:1-aminocyclopropane-1-carboxylate deaminase/D-cysteine desulfhydrase-like pyridoxal-dependent ACC family enzyme